MKQKHNLAIYGKHKYSCKEINNKKKEILRFFRLFMIKLVYEKNNNYASFCL